MPADDRLTREGGTGDLSSALEALGHLAAEAGSAAVARDAAVLVSRLDEGRFFVACLGQFKRGKSTLLNALIGESILPAGVVPVTSAVTILRHGPARAARVAFASGESIAIDVADLASYVAEELNPENAKGVAAVEICVPSPLFASGMCLVDTPGIGSVFAGNTAVTRQFLPQVDAALLVLGADPPISGDELSMIDVVARETSTIIVVLNKADRFSPAEIAEASAFTARILGARLGRRVDPILQVSAAERLAAGPTRDWPRLLAALEALASTSGAGLVRSAQIRGLGRLALRLLHDLDERRGALTRPQEESARRIVALRTCAADAEHGLRDLAPLFEAEQRALARRFEQERARFLDGARSAAIAELAVALDTASEPGRGDVRRRAITLAQEIAERRVAAWGVEIEPVAERLYRGAMERFVARVDDILGHLAESTESARVDVSPELVLDLGFRARRRFHFHDLLTLTAPGAATWLLDRVRSRRGLVEAARADATVYLERLLSTNTARVANDLAERVLESRRRLEAEVLGALRDLSASTERSLDEARRLRSAGDAAVRGELERLESLRVRAEALCSGLAEA